MTGNENLFDSELAILPIMTATWETDPMDAIIQYQNKILRNKIGLWKGRRIIDLFNVVSSGSGEKMLKELIEKKKISMPGLINDLEVKFHSRMGSKHIQLTISDNTEINRLRDSNKRNEIISSFMDVSSHELRTPLSIILGYIPFLLEFKSDQKKFEHTIDVIEKNAQKLNHIVNDIFKLIYENDMKLLKQRKVKCNIGECIAGAFDMFEDYLSNYEFSHDNLNLNDTKMVKIAQINLNAILNEIMINLRRNTPPGGKIEIKTFDENSDVHLRIGNECKGIPPEFLEKVFNPFFRYQDPAHHSTGYEYGKGGVGMGLAILKKFVIQVKGKVWFENKFAYEANKGNVVVMHIVFPAV